MADRTTPPPRGDSGERRPAPPRPTGGYSERPQSTRPAGSYGERPQSPRPAGSYGERPQSSRPAGSYGERPQSSRPAGSYGERPQPSRPAGSYGERPQSSRPAGSYSERPQSSRPAGSYGERRPAAPRSPGSPRQSSPRRTDVIRCENCGEDYSITYKRCPFCDERPGRGGVSGKRVSNTRGGGYGRPVNPIQIAGLVISLVLIASALFIVFRFVGAPLFGNRKPSESSSQSQVSSQKGSNSSVPTVTPPALQSIALNNADLSLDNGDSYQLVANLLPSGAVGEVTWTSSDPTVAAVDASGTVTNLNAGGSDATVTITAACGDISAQASVTCKGKTGGGGSTGPVSSGSTGRIVNAEKGLNIRSGPGKNYEVIASAKNGATVTILGEENGFYKVKYSGEKTGYVSKDYVSVG